ncbi:MAG: IS1380 family transposase [Elusimicrobia bacterium]|nr:IS1380 family transposase [Elusimicrobiota bacterium]
MITRVLEKYKVSMTNLAVTSYAGLPLLLGMAKSLGLEERLNGLPVKERARGYRPAETIFSLMGLLQSGGVALDDMDLLNGDEGLRALLGKFPAANTVGELLRRFGNSAIHRLGQIQLETAVKVIRSAGLKSVVVDVDSFFVESQKSDAVMNYEGKTGYNPVAVTCAELKMPMAGLFRPGNASAMANVAGLLERVLEAVKGIGVRVRSDSAGFQADVVRVLRAKGARFTITARKDAAVLETIRGIKPECWRKYEGGAWENRETEIAQTVHAFGAEDLAAHRMIVIRWKKTNPELFDKEPYEYHAVITNMDDWSGEMVLQFHRTRQDGSENVNKELKGGIGLSKLPCRAMKANAAYFQVALLAYTVFAATKHLALPKSWGSLTIETVRSRLIRLAGVVAKRARYVWLKIGKGYPYMKCFEDARWRIIGLSVEIATG